jgi:hypothetical protein
MDEKGETPLEKLVNTPPKLIANDWQVYNIENDQVVIYFTTVLNPVLKQENITDALSQIAQAGKYNVKDADLISIQKEADKKYGQATRIDLSKLSAQEMKYGKVCYIQFNTEMNSKTRAYKGLKTAEDKKLAELTHGNIDRYKRTRKHTKVFYQTMKLYSMRGHQRTRIFFPSPTFVKENTAKNNLVAGNWLARLFMAGLIVDDEYQRMRPI